MIDNLTSPKVYCTDFVAKRVPNPKYGRFLPEHHLCQVEGKSKVFPHNLLAITKNVFTPLTVVCSSANRYVPAGLYIPGRRVRPYGRQYGRVGALYHGVRRRGGVVLHAACHAHRLPDPETSSCTAGTQIVLYYIATRPIHSLAD